MIFSEKTVSQIAAADLGEIIPVVGQISDLGPHRIAISRAAHVCWICGYMVEVDVEVPFLEITKPQKCPELNGCGSQKTLKLQEDRSTFIDIRSFNICGKNDYYPNYDFKIYTTDMASIIEINSDVEMQVKILRKSVNSKDKHFELYGFTEKVNISLISRNKEEEELVSSLSKGGRNSNQIVRNALRDICHQRGIATLTDVLNRCEPKGISEFQVEEVISKMLQAGELFSPINGEYSFAR